MPLPYPTGWPSPSAGYPHMPAAPLSSSLSCYQLPVKMETGFTPEHVIHHEAHVIIEHPLKAFSPQQIVDGKAHWQKAVEYRTHPLVLKNSRFLL